MNRRPGKREGGKSGEWLFGLVTVKSSNVRMEMETTEEGTLIPLLLHITSVKSNNPSKGRVVTGVSI